MFIEVVDAAGVQQFINLDRIENIRDCGDHVKFDYGKACLNARITFAGLRKELAGHGLLLRDTNLQDLASPEAPNGGLALLGKSADLMEEYSFRAPANFSRVWELKLHNLASVIREALNE